jgi:hypothetical protein
LRLCSEESIDKKLDVSKLKNEDQQTLYALGNQGSIGDV